jgi:hypothetical protein
MQNLEIHTVSISIRIEFGDVEVKKLQLRFSIISFSKEDPT